MRRILYLLLAMVTIVSACATNAAESPPQDSTTTTLDAATTQPSVAVPVTAPASSSTSSSLATTTTTIAAATTTSAMPTATPAPPAQMTVAPWFFIDEPGRTGRTGPFLVPVYREVPHTKAVARASLEQLFRGPSTDETNGTPTISTTIPAGVMVLGLTIKEGIATVDLSSEFGGTDTSPVVAQRMAQVVFTLTSIPHVNEVLFRQVGKPIAAQTSDGQLVNRPVLKADYLEFAAALTVEQPIYGGGGSNPLHVTGFGAVFEAAFNWVLTDDDGLIIAEGHEMTTNGTGWGGFDFTIEYEIDSKQRGALIVWANSAENGQRIDIREYPIALIP